MRIKRRLFVMLVSSLLVTSVTDAAAKQKRQFPIRVPDPQLIDWIANGSLPVRMGAIAHLETVPVRERSNAVQEAVIQELSRLNSWVEQRNRERRAGAVVVPTAQSAKTEGYRIAVARLVTDSPHPNATHALVAALDIGPLVSKSLSGYGEVVVPAVVRIARQGNPDTQVVEEAFRTLQYMLESKVPLTASSRDLILTATVERLTGKQHFLVVGAACRLAVVTGDIALRRRVEQLASDYREVADMGIADKRSADIVRQHARAALSKSK